MQTQPHNRTLAVGEQLRAWRGRRRLSQLDLALDAEISARHLSFLETGRSRPSRPMLLRLAERLNIPARDRNLLLVAAGFAPALPERSLDDPALAAARRAVELVLKAHEPFPALAVDRHWHMVAANSGVAPFLAGVAPHLLEPPVNVLRLSLHPEGVAPRIVNLAEWRAHIFHRLERGRGSADQGLADLPRSCAPTRRRLESPGRLWRSRRAAGAALGQGRAFLPQHHHHVRNADRHHAFGAAIEAFLPGTSGRRIAGRRIKLGAGGATGKVRSTRPGGGGTMWTANDIHTPCQAVPMAEIRAFHG